MKESLAVKIFDYFIFSSLFIAMCAVLMVYQANELFHLHYETRDFIGFVFFSTVCSYNFHWYFTPDTVSENKRTVWTQQHKWLHILLICIGAAGALFFFAPLSHYWFWIGISMILTFLYSAPKLPFHFARFLKQIAIGKTIFLALVWAYVTTILPIILSGNEWNTGHLLFCVGRFFLIYAICIIFDFRDREQDRREGIKSMITIFDERGVDILFFTSLAVFCISTILLLKFGFAMVIVAMMLVPAIIVAALYPYAKRNPSDYLYYFLLDGMMALSALLTSFLSF